MKKVAHIFTSGGSHRILADKLTLLQEKGYIVETISSKKGYKEEFMKDYNLDTKFISMNREINLVDDLKSIVKMYGLLKKEDYDIVHTHTAKAGIIGRIAAKLAGIPIVLHTAHGLPFFEGQSKLKYHMYRLFEKIGSWFCDAIGSQNQDDIKKIKAYAPNKKVYYEGNGVDLPKLDKKLKEISEEDLNKIREQWNIGEDTKIILKAARFEPVKNHQFLLKGLKKLINEYNNDFLCLLAGKGHLKEEIKELINDYGLNNNVKIIGYQTNIFHYIKLADLVVLTSKKEGVPRIIMESMAFSKPVIATDVLGTRDVVEHDKTGYLVSLGDVKNLANYLNKLLINKKLRKRFGEASRQVIEKGFTEQIVVDRLDEIYQQLLNV
ncbi:glycosyltransferase family 4 protein [Fuchsiella alkaliacetigena]|uniref:glycosyltransferase family 4 protein n=1 Tax=Fuchsiella alkaliacetigena TaxID=957042 RepID=UPI00200AA3BF|nr:glycosyltransferase family 4 protein [Fuchsiella alkaliacetigena]MCK8824333.1 glycosyltransferase family 4 protein [Fuchsiella alkaliacetigena]